MDANQKGAGSSALQHGFSLAARNNTTEPGQVVMRAGLTKDGEENGVGTTVKNQLHGEEILNRDWIGEYQKKKNSTDRDNPTPETSSLFLNQRKMSL